MKSAPREIHEFRWHHRLAPGDGAHDLGAVDPHQHRVAHARVGGERARHRLRATASVIGVAEVEVDLLRAGVGDGEDADPPGAGDVLELGEEGEPEVEANVGLPGAHLLELGVHVGDDPERDPVEVRLSCRIPVVVVAHQHDLMGGVVALEHEGTGAVDDVVEGVGAPVGIGVAAAAGEVDDLLGALEVAVAAEGVLQQARGEDPVHPGAEREVGAVDAPEAERRLQRTVLGAADQPVVPRGPADRGRIVGAVAQPVRTASSRRRRVPRRWRRRARARRGAASR